MKKVFFVVMASCLLVLIGLDGRDRRIVWSVAMAEYFDDSSASTEEEDFKSIDQINQDTTFEDSATPIEEEDIKSIDQINQDTSFEDSATPIEEEDTKSIDQLNRDW